MLNLFLSLHCLIFHLYITIFVFNFIKKKLKLSINRDSKKLRLKIRLFQWYSHTTSIFISWIYIYIYIKKEKTVSATLSWHLQRLALNRGKNRRGIHGYKIINKSNKKNIIHSSNLKQGNVYITRSFILSQ